MTKRAPTPEPKPEPKVEEPKPTWDAWTSELASLRERQAFCKQNRIAFLQPDLDRIAWLEEKIAEDTAWRSSPEMKAIDDAIAALQIEIDKGKL